VHSLGYVNLRQKKQNPNETPMKNYNKRKKTYQHLNIEERETIVIGLELNKTLSEIERAAKLIAINIGSVIIKTDSGKDPLYPILITAEGTTFYGLKSLKERVICYLKKFLSNKKQRYYEIVKVENSTLIGAAIAGLTN